MPVLRRIGVSIRDGRYEVDSPVWPVFAVVEDVADQVKVLVFFMVGILTRSCLFGLLLFWFEGGFWTAGWTNLDC